MFELNVLDSNISGEEPVVNYSSEGGRKRFVTTGVMRAPRNRRITGKTSRLEQTTGEAAQNITKTRSRP